ncbi:MAG TPA: hypothetical protein VIV11_25385 [Kofleriaceae bacterium]
MNIEVTCRMPRDELLGLLNTMSPIEQQRITAEIEVQPAPTDLVIRFKEANQLSHVRVIVIGASFVVSFCCGLLAVLL